MLPALALGSVARCSRCDAVLRRPRRDPLERGLALNLAALALLAIACTATLLTVSTFGMYRAATVFSGPAGFEQHRVWELAVAVAFMTIAAPLLRLGLVIYVLAGLRSARPPKHLRIAFRWAEWLRPWSMVEVYLLGVFVAYTELPGLIHIEIGAGLYALVALMMTMVAADAVLDRQAVWEEMERRGLPDLPVDHAATAATGWVAGAVGCDTCGLVSLPPAASRDNCPRCGSRLEARKPDSIARTWALVITSAILYVPANILPVLAFIELGSGSPHTIIGGARELLNAGMWPLALLVFLASIGVPCLKLVSLVLLMLTTQRGIVVAVAPADGSLPAGEHDRALVDDRHLHGVGADRPGAVRRGGDDQPGTRGRGLRGCGDLDHARRRILRPQADVGCRACGPASAGRAGGPTRRASRCPRMTRPELVSCCPERMPPRRQTGA